MRAMRAEAFGGYQDFKLTDIPAPALSDGRVLVRMTAAGVTPLDHTILFGQYPNAKAPLMLGNEGAGIVEGSGTVEYPTGSSVMFTGPYGVLENGTLSELVAVQKEHLCLVTDKVEHAAAAGLPVAYLTAFLTLKGRIPGGENRPRSSNRRLGGQRHHAAGQSARSQARDFDDHQSRKGGTGQRTGLFRGDRSFRRRIGRGRAPSDRRLRGRHCRGCYRRTDPEPSARNSGAGWMSHDTRLCREQEDNH